MDRKSQEIDCIMQSQHNRGMRVLTIRNVPDELYRSISTRAQRNRRSLQQEALALLERVRGLGRAESVERAQTIRAQLAGRPLGDTVREVRAERRR